MSVAMQAGGAAGFIFLCMAFSVAHANAPEKKAPKPVLVKRLKLKDLPGRWAGIGNMSFRDGTKERMKCRIVYRFQSSQDLIQKIWCRNRNIRVEVQARIINRDGKLLGSWDDRIYSMSGKLNGRFQGNQIKAKLQGSFFTAHLNIAVIGGQQTIRLTPNKGQLQSMHIRLARG